MIKSESKLKGRKSLRTQYIFAASTVCGVLIVASLFSDLYFYNITSQNTAALNLHNSINTKIGELDNAIWKTDKSLYILISSADKTDSNRIIENLNDVNKKLTGIREISGFDKTGLKELIVSLEKKHKRLEEDVHKLLSLRTNDDWLYPMLPFINAKLLNSNNNFETAISQAINETFEAGEHKYTGKVFRLLDRIRNTWRLNILDFRSILLRFAGLNTKNISQEKNIENYYLLLQNQLHELEKYKDNGELGFETELALDDMLLNSKKWYADYQSLMDIKRSNVWRADVNYIHTIIQPQQKEIFDELEVFKKELSEWSFSNIQQVKKAALQINFELWILTFVATLFAILIYRMLAKSILIPVASIANSISYKNNISKNIEYPDSGSEEVFTLITAFNSMQDQINHRQLVLEFQAMHDSLTGLPNRVLLQDRLEQGIQHATRNESMLALLLLDLDRFKEINDTLGHPVGDNVLRELARRLERFLRSSDTVARLGGDEFAIITNYKDKQQIQSFVKKIVKEIEKVIVVEQHQLYVGVSIGIAIYPQHGENAETLIRRADIAMYSAKRDNKDQEFYDIEKDYHNSESLTLVSELKEELSKPADQIQLHFQPIIDIKTNEIIAAEALVRWEHPAHGAMPAEHIISLAEQTGLITELTYWVLNESLYRYSLWENDNIRVSVNLSALNLHDLNLIPYIRKKLEEFNLSAEILTLEITESAVMNDPVMAQKVLNELKEMGVGLVIDDYGTGLSSLAYLKSLPVKCLKIDKSFVMDMQTSENDSIIIQSTIDMAHNLGLTVVAEGVEKKETLASLRKLNCDFVQGFYIAHPMSSDLFIKWMSDYSPGIEV